MALTAGKEESGWDVGGSNKLLGVIDKRWDDQRIDKTRPSSSSASRACSIGFCVSAFAHATASSIFCSLVGASVATSLSSSITASSSAVACSVVAGAALSVVTSISLSPMVGADGRVDPWKTVS